MSLVGAKPLSLAWEQRVGAVVIGEASKVVVSGGGDGDVVPLALWHGTLAGIATVVGVVKATPQGVGIQEAVGGVLGPVMVTVGVRVDGGARSVVGGVRGWGNPRGDASDGWGEGWGNPRGDASDGWGGGWGHAKDTVKFSENKEKQTGGWGSTPATVTSWGDGDTWGTFSNPIAAENQKENPTESNKAILPPPRIRLPGNEDKPPKTSGTNRVPIANMRWGEGSSHSKHTPRLNTNIPAAMEVDSPGTKSETPFSAVYSQPQSARPSDRGARGSDTPTASTPGGSSRRKRKHDAAFEDKFNLFKEYVKAWERGVRTRFMLVEAEAKRDRWFRTQKSTSYVRIGEAGRRLLDAQRAECDKEVDIQKEKHSSAITSLVEFHDAITSNLDLGQRYNIGEEARQQ
ncbi:hypothetical protein PAXRUDRAFT_278805 [Paxillus rubicundulus Ve08.2h10]|uniref:Uncharacterized protein n=1 Tax=Paxillus rubicundulus Ve08.2h10 TaxID=930991 RepID=A0A0D0E0F4_9AGAM|nr:hypothetical protein PAXRUDRAFT_278805 [Paxillus rubicundulus Ve08.2h10]